MSYSFRFILIFCLILFLANSTIISNDGLKEAIKLQSAFNNIAEKTFPAVVVITVKKELNKNVPPILEYFFDFRERRSPQIPQQKAPVIEGKGSGFFVNEDGYILTNYHVIADNDEIIVRLKDNTEYNAEIKGADPKTDLALLKVNCPNKTPFLSFADSDKVKVGDWAIAVGAPYNFDYTMTVGVVSQKGRSVGINVYENYIQTDASINRGNSGGPLLDIEGNVIGVNDFIFTGGYSEGNIGLGFAIPSNMAKEVMQELISKGEVERAWIGIAMEALSTEMKKQFNAENGVLVREVFADDPADLGGIEPGDVIISVDNSPVNTPKDVQNLILKRKPGERVIFKISRNGKIIELPITPKKQDSKKFAGAGQTPNDELRKRFGLEVKERNNEIEITEVLPQSPAEKVGLTQGMKILAVNKKKVKNLSEFLNAISKKEGSVLLYVCDQRTKKFVVLNEKD